MFLLRFKTESAAFGEETGEPEVPPECAEECARILETVADQLRAGDTSRLIFDINGTAIGDWTL